MASDDLIIKSYVHIIKSKKLIFNIFIKGLSNFGLFKNVDLNIKGNQT